jgi:cephalosporin hydroxylase
MRIRQLDADLLGAIPVFCDSCNRKIPITEDRRFCPTCNKDACLSCPACQSDHQVADYRGFPRLEGDLKSVLEKTEKYMAESFGGLFENDNTYMFGWLKSLHEILSAHGVEVRPDASPTQAAPKGQSRRVSGLTWVLDNGEAYLRDWVSLREMGRFVDYFDRRSFAGGLPRQNTLVYSQGGAAPLRWNGLPMMKTVWDYALTSLMVQEIRPGTIIELGTASGASAMWYADTQKSFGIKPNVITVDRICARRGHDGVRFLQGDVEEIENCLTGDFLENQPRPWIVVEDTHCNIGGILRYLHQFLMKGDYICIEDADAECELALFLASHQSRYKVDTHFTDFFGHNATSAPDQIFCLVS